MKTNVYRLRRTKADLPVVAELAAEAASLHHLTPKQGRRLLLLSEELIEMLEKMRETRERIRRLSVIIKTDDVSPAFLFMEGFSYGVNDLYASGRFLSHCVEAAPFRIYCTVQGKRPHMSAERSDHMLENMTAPAAPQGVFPARLSLAMGYVPYQTWEEPMAPKDAFCAGTAFPSLVMPFMMEKGGVQDARAVFGYNGKG